LTEVRVGRRPQRLTSYRPMLARRGDVELNAYARQIWRRSAIVAVLGLALIGGAAWLYVTLRPREEVAAEQREFTDKVRCSECGYEGLIQVSTREKFPLTCPKCKARSLWKVWRCRDCGYEFVFKPSRDDQESSAVTVRCPKCGSMSVGSAARPPHAARRP
jgi:predicted Zn-ribbon and HTH transcriptional regulator